MLDIIKKAAVAAMEAAGPVQLLEATVLTPPPGLSIQIGLDTKNPIPAEMLSVSERLTSYEREVELEGDFEIEGVLQTSDYSGDGKISGEGTFSGVIKFVDELQAGEKVLVMSFQGGQSFYIAERLVKYGADS
ncbi:DUF2577 family protein [Paenibacillus sp. ClWae2A]|uniref:DUF2577 family protein n=1 Tax=Paenibacillus sp. ClWae2A TaxID=3057177 RepID=UPI0028F52F2B|nr:DUF2577 family protein [Paenibacillus sp. ClWae2A]MDT9719121.1 DUF2577 family protein [Paenibacillus sp. ClWae2A]